jgi:hypothetical protein
MQRLKKRKEKHRLPRKLIGQCNAKTNMKKAIHANANALFNAQAANAQMSSKQATKN